MSAHSREERAYPDVVRAYPGDERTYRLPDSPTVGGSFRAALIDFYFNSWRLVPANLLWGIGLLAFILLLGTFPPAAPLVLILMAVPAAGVYRLATLIVRDRSVAFSDALDAWRRFFLPALGTGGALTILTLVLGFNLIVGLASMEPLGWVFGTLGGWGLLASWSVAIPFWPLLLDPLRDGEPWPAKLRLALTVVLVAPLRSALLIAVVVILTVISTIFFAALPTITIAILALLTARYTLPLADRIEGRRTQPLPE